MNFSEYVLRWPHGSKDKDHWAHYAVASWTQNFENLSEESRETALVFGSSEVKWLKKRRPYYKVWPSFVDVLLKVKLDLDFDQVPSGRLLVALRLSESQIITHDGWIISSVLMYRDEQRLNVLSQLRTGDDPRFRMSANSLVHGACDGTIEEMIESMSEYSEVRGHVRKRPIEIRKDAIRLAIGVCLLANDSDYLEREVLARDRQKYKETKDKKFITRAINRGVNGFHLGREFESIPHFRRPHFAIRYTGQGGKIPKLVPVKGSVVRRDKAKKIPTGYMTPEGKEIES